MLAALFLIFIVAWATQGVIAHFRDAAEKSGAALADVLALSVYVSAIVVALLVYTGNAPLLSR